MISLLRPPPKEGSIVLKTNIMGHRGPESCTYQLDDCREITVINNSNNHYYYSITTYYKSDTL